MSTGRSIAIVIMLGLSSALLAGGCGTTRSPVSTVRYANAPTVWVVNDRSNVAAPPAENRFFRALYHFDGFWHSRIDRWMEMRDQGRAANVNAMDEVPDSTWFENRIGQQDLSPEDIAIGPNTTGSPEDHRPWTIRSSKVGGVTVGYIVKDSRGIKYVLKFDQKGVPEVETGADVILQRLLWACGYFVPEDYVVYFRKQDLLLAEDAVVKDPMGNEKPLTREMLEQQLATIEIAADGTIRGLASQFLPGRPLGGHVRDGVRNDDPNDRIAHQKRRELRGQLPIYAWLDHSDAKEDNSLDVYVEDPADSSIHYVVHYLLDFGKGLGAQPFINGRRFVGHAYAFDFGDFGKSLASLGLWQRPWEDRKPPGIRGVGLFDSEPYDPANWHPYTPSYFPFHDADRFDGFWGTKILMRLSPDHIRAAVDQARFTDPAASRYITQTLVERQRKTARYWFGLVNPLDRFTTEGHGDSWSLCFDDLTVLYNLEATIDATHYSAQAYDFDGRPTGWKRVQKGELSGRSCLGGLLPTGSRDGYTIVKLHTQRPGADLPATEVHLAQDPDSGNLRVIGIRRQ